ncbi:DMT family transporter [Longispora albida]|uniref:DMT family transporter n=1 Tax=Longispora albida TaxID=203523 RepID=UPI000380E484|nr:multidrug efflux SMR transporter [Longispora albida]
MVKWLLLALAILVEVGATLLVKVSDGFTRLWPTVGLLAGYTLSFYLDSVVVRMGVPIAITYSLWSGAGIVLVAVASRYLFGDVLSPAAAAGMAVIVVGVAITTVATAGTH